MLQKKSFFLLDEKWALDKFPCSTTHTPVNNFLEGTSELWWFVFLAGVVQRNAYGFPSFPWKNPNSNSLLVTRTAKKTALWKESSNHCWILVYIKNAFIFWKYFSTKKYKMILSNNFILNYIHILLQAV